MGEGQARSSVGSMETGTASQLSYQGSPIYKETGHQQEREQKQITEIKANGVAKQDNFKINI